MDRRLKKQAFWFGPIIQAVGRDVSMWIFAWQCAAEVSIGLMWWHAIRDCRDRTGCWNLTSKKGSEDLQEGLRIHQTIGKQDLMNYARLLHELC